MDVKYIPSDWEKMRAGIGDLIGDWAWGDGVFDPLKDICENLEDAKSEIADNDHDGVISFHYTSQKNKYDKLYEDFDLLHSFTGKVGDIVDRTIDQPFYEDMDAFVEAMRDLTISNYTTRNRIGATETQMIYAGSYGPRQSLEVPKKEVSLDDLFSGGNFFGEQMKLEYEEWKKLNPDKDISQEEYRQATLNTRAFEYESIRNQQENKEFWVQLGALVVIVGATIICPPAGMALGAAYGAMELGSAVSGKDWISGRELGTGERWFRGLLAPLDIVPGVSGLTKFSSTVRLAHISGDIGKLGLRTGVKGSLKQGMTHIDNMIKTAGQQTAVRLRSASSAIKDVSNLVKKKLAKDIIEVGKLADSAITSVKNNNPFRHLNLEPEYAGIGKVDGAVENTHAVENKLKDIINRMEVNLGGGTKVSGEELSKIKVGKSDLDNLRKKWNVPETHTIAVGKTDVKGLENSVFEGGSPLVRKEAGLPDLDAIMPNRPIQAPRKSPQFTKHAEEGVINEFITSVKKAELNPNDVKGTLSIHQSNPRGVCTACIQGITNPKVKAGIFMQLTQMFPNLTIKVSSEVKAGVKAAGKLNFTLKGGKLIN